MSNNPKKDPCKKTACLIQKCLKENKYQESACEEVLELMRECCRQHKSVSLCCEGIDITPRTKNLEITKPIRATK